MENAIKLTNINKSLGDFKIDQMNLTIPKGYITGFIGPNGSGKSTTIKLIMDLLKVDGGKIDILGYDHEKEGKKARERIGFVYPENVYYDHLSVNHTEKLVSNFYSQWDRSVFQELCHRFELPQNKKVKDLSTGMKVKLALALALSHHAELIILDEPTSGLDPLVRSEILDILHDLLVDEGNTIFFSSHITTDLEKIADYIVFINEGKVIMQDEKDELLNRYRIIKGSIDHLDKDTRSLLIGIREHEHGFIGLTKEADSFHELFGNQVIIEPATLEDIMVYTLKEVR